MWAGSFTSLLLLMLINAQGYDKEHKLQTTQSTLETADTAYRSRCTRRYTPGMCEESVASVWTFSFNLQNCTERLGCSTSHRTNRFSSYRQCMRRCRPLIDIYLQILAIENNTSLSYLRNQPGKTSRREGDTNLSDLNALSDVDDDDEEETSPSGDPLFNMYYRDDGELEVSLPPDIDYVGQSQEASVDYLYDDEE